jgi:hypothetical protein
MNSVFKICHVGLDSFPLILPGDNKGGKGERMSDREEKEEDKGGDKEKKKEE